MMMQLLEGLPPRSRAWNTALAVAPGELDLTIRREDIEGRIPPRLFGTRLLSNGPGWNQIGRILVHPFDGHGYVRSFSFCEDGSLRLRGRFVETQVYKDEAKTGKMLYRGLATNPDRPFWQNMGIRGTPRNVANTTIVRWGDRLLAGWEGGAPYALDADTLGTRGEDDFGGVIAGQATLAHMKHDPVHDRLVLCSVRTGRETAFTFRELDTTEQVVSTRQVSLPGMLFTHDFAMTSSHYVLGGNPLKLKPFELLKMALGGSTLLRAVAPNDRKPGALHLIPRHDDGPVRTIALPDSTFIIHFGNAFERDGTTYVDACLFTRFELGEEFGYTGPRTPFDPTLPEARGPQRLMRITIPPGATEASWTPLTTHGVDFPRFHPDHESLDTPFLFGATRKDTRYSDPFDSILCVDLQDQERPAQLWTAPEDVFVGEPIFVPDPTEDRKGHVLSLLSDGLHEQTTLAIFDATSLEAGPLAAIKMPLLPIAFHGEWDPQTTD